VLSKTERIKYSGLFQQAFQKGKTFKSQNLRLTFTQSLPQFQTKLPLVGFVVSKNFSKKAVERNKIKRRLREIYRIFRIDAHNSSKLKSLGLIVVSVKPESASLNYDVLKQELEFLLKKSLSL
jgi:ribonuclease P protein component